MDKILKTALPRNAKTTRPLLSAKCSQKELFDAVESELADSSGSEQILQALKPRNAGELTPEGACLHDLLLYGT